MWQFWLIAAGILFIVEMATVGFLVFWFAIGALITMIFSLFVSNIYIQFIIFIATSVALIFLTKPFVNKFINKDKSVATNAYSIIGHTGIVIKEINPILATGQIKVNGEVWSAKTTSNGIIPENTEIEVTQIEGVKAVVKLADKKYTVNDIKV